MTDDQRVQQLLDRINVSNATPEEVCESSPELLPVVRDRWRAMRRLQADLDVLFPSSRSEPGSPPGWTALPEIPGYEVEAVLGRGGMGIVFRARHVRLNRPVAVKMLLSGEYAARRERDRFQCEAEAVAKLRHPNIIQIYDVGDVDGRPYFTMELADGGSLAKKLAGTPQPVGEAVELVATLARAVHAAHACGVVHRDLKPANVLLTDDGTPNCPVPKIADFGLAARLERNNGSCFTLEAAPLGTASYMSPEQALGGAAPAGLCSRVDVYALGAILYELLTGRPPFRAATNAETIQQVISQEPAPPSRLNGQVPRYLDTICLKCLSKEPSRRYGSAAELADDLRRYLEGRPILARPAGWAERSWRWARRNPTGAALLATALSLVGLAIGGGMWAAQQRGERRAEAAQADRDLRNDVGSAVAQAASFRQRFHFGEARELLEQARQRLGPEGPEDLRRLVEHAQADLNLAERLDSARIETVTFAAGPRGLSVAEPLYASAFAEAELPRTGEDTKAVAARVRDSALRAELIAALDDWASITADHGRREWLLEVAREADENLARNRLRRPELWNNIELWKDPEKLKQVTKELEAAEFSPQLANALGRVAQRSGGNPVPLLTMAQVRYPQDFWLNFELASTLSWARRWDECIGYYRAALAVRPDVSAAHNNLGHVLYSRGRQYDAEAIGHFEEALRLNPQSIGAHISLGTALANTGRLEKGVDHIQQGLRLDPKLAVDPAGVSALLSDATHTAVLAAAGQYSGKGRRMDDAERTQWRRRALGWLRAYLELAIKLQDSGKRAAWSPAGWQKDSVLTSVRDPAELAKLPAAEREQWQLLWADVAAHVAADPLGQGHAHAARREWAKAADCYARDLKQGPTDDGHFWFEYAALSLLSGDQAGYEKVCAHMIEKCGKAGGPRAYHVARACTLAADAFVDAGLPRRLAEKELQTSAEQFWSLTEQGALAYRAGRFQDAASLFEQSLNADAAPGRAVVNWVWLALANHRLGNPEEARRWLVNAQAWLDSYRDGMPVRAEAEVGLHLHNWLEAYVLRREAETLIH